MTRTRISKGTSHDSLPKTQYLFGANPKLPVLTKKDFVQRYKRSEFGNASPTWDNYDEWAKSWWERNWTYLKDRNVDGIPPTLYHIRNRIAGGDTWYDVLWSDMYVTWGVARNRVGEENLYISEMAPHQYNVIQGEVWQNTSHLYLTYSDLPDLPMRDALKNGLKYCEGLEAVMLLRRSLCPNSWDWLNQLLDCYSDHVIEFSTFSVMWGTIPHFNTVYWEIRGGY